MSRTTDHPHDRRSRAMLFGLAATVVAIALYFAMGMPGMDHGGTNGSMGAMDHANKPAVAELTPEAFAARMASPEAVVVNVHVPYAGELAGTDHFVPYDQTLRGLATLSRDDDLLLYCQTGTMSEAAAQELLDDGFSRVAHLAGGMEAWQDSGREVLGRPGRSG